MPPPTLNYEEPENSACDRADPIEYFDWGGKSRFAGSGVYAKPTPVKNVPLCSDPLPVRHIC